VAPKVLTLVIVMRWAVEPPSAQGHQRCTMMRVVAGVGAEVRAATAADAAEVENLTRNSRVQVVKAVVEVSALHAVLPWHLSAASRLEEEEMEVIGESGSHVQVEVPEADSVGHRVPTARRCDKRGRKTRVAPFVVPVQLVLRSAEPQTWWS